MAVRYSIARPCERAARPVCCGAVSAIGLFWEANRVISASFIILILRVVVLLFVLTVVLTIRRSAVVGRRQPPMRCYMARSTPSANGRLARPSKVDKVTRPAA